MSENYKIYPMEVPYNFRPNFFQGLDAMCQYKEYIKFIYMPPWKEDYSGNTREYLWDCPWAPKTREDYLDRLQKIQSYEVPVCILLQNNSTYDLFEKYYTLGVRHFIVGNDSLAKQIKENYNDTYLVASITKVLFSKDIIENDYSMYDEIVLWFWFNRHLEEIKTLPKKYKYSLQVNAGCYYNCQWHEYHWYHYHDDFMNLGLAFNPNLPCVKYRQVDRNQIIIPPEDLSYFDPYVEGYKLVDRESSTDLIVNHFLSYVFRNSFVADLGNCYDVNEEFYKRTGHIKPIDFYNIPDSYNPLAYLEGDYE